MNDEGRLASAPRPDLIRRSESSTESRRSLLERFGALYGELGLAIGWTQGIEGEAAKVSKYWQSRPDRLVDAEHGAGIFRRGLTRNPVVPLRSLADPLGQG